MNKPSLKAVPADPVISPITGIFGARISNIDVAQVGPEQAEWLQEVLREYKVIVLPDQQHVGASELASFGRLFGEVDVEPHHIHAGVEGDQAVKALVMDGSPGTVEHGLQDPWHTDGCMRETTRYISILQGIDVPDYGRDTVFVDMEAAYDFLSAPMRNIVDGLTAIHSWGDRNPGAPKTEHPAVLVDKVNGRKALYVNAVYTAAIKGMHAHESTALLNVLFQQARFPHIQLRVSWEPGQIVIWDNEKVQHGVIFDRVYRRVMHRVMVN